jgi:7-carboxy-7-deazaguanine synthase
VPPVAKLRIAEVFSSVQGEGQWSGVPSTFVRVSGCNLRCVWCDTPFASWNPEGDFHEVDDLVERIGALGNGHVVITGGEPMLFEPVERLAWKLAARGHTITVETAGTVFRKLRCHLMSISPKLSTSTPTDDPVWAARHEEARINLPVLKRLIEGYQVQLKFVVGSDQERDLAEIAALLARLPYVRPQNVMLMPEGTDAAALLERQRRLVDVCIANGWRLCPRLHVELFGNVRGT